MAEMNARNSVRVRKKVNQEGNNTSPASPTNERRKKEIGLRNTEYDADPLKESSQHRSQFALQLQVH